MPAQNNQTTVLLAWSKLVLVSEGQDPPGLNLRVSARLSGQLLHCITSITLRAQYFSFFPGALPRSIAKKSGETGRDAHLLDHHSEQRGVEVGAFRSITVRSISLIRFYKDCRGSALRQEVPNPRGRIL
jgi:hypothetical protein